MQSARLWLSAEFPKGLHQLTLLCGGDVLVAEKDDAAMGDEGGEVAEIVGGVEQGRDLEACGEFGTDDGGGFMMGIGQEVRVLRGGRKRGRACSRPWRPRASSPWRRAERLRLLRYGLPEIFLTGKGMAKSGPWLALR
jgi:hypothetical protein